MKGAYNYTDMNRVGEAEQYIYDRMLALPEELDAYRESKGIEDSPEFHVPYNPSEINVSPLTDITMNTGPSSLVVLVYLLNLINLSQVLTLPDDAPSCPVTMDMMTYSMANDIERLLYMIDHALSELESELYQKIDHAVLSFPYTNAFYSGE